VYDGTVVGLYYYNNRWVLSTSKGYDMNEVKWEGKTYQSLFEECLQKYGMTWDDFTGQLNTSNCYSFGFSNPHMHKFSTELQIWFISSVCLNQKSNVYLWTSLTSPIQSIPPQEKVESVENLEYLYRTVKKALSSYIKDRNNACLGFILRSVNYNETGDHSDLIIESSLMQYVRKIWYDQALVTTCKNYEYDRNLYASLNAYLTESLYQNFIQVFPQYMALFERFATKIQELVDNMIEGPTGDSPLDIASRTLLNNFRNSLGYDITDKPIEEKRKILSEYVIHNENIHILMPLF
jgi:hypothetical protein